MYQSTTIIGNLGRDPELRITPGGSHVLTLNVAVNKKWQQLGEWKESTTWYRASVWGERADQLEQRGLTRGTLVMVVGEMLEPNVYTHTGTGEQRASLEMKANVVRVLQTAQDNHSSDVGELSAEDNGGIPW